MSIALVAKDDVPVAEIRNLLSRQGIGAVSVVRMNELLGGQQEVAQVDLSILVLTKQDIPSAGEVINQLRLKLSQGQRLVLCMPCSHDHHKLLLQLGADEIISPAGLAPEQVAERVLSYLILNKLVQPYIYDGMLGATWQMRKLYADIERFAPLREPVLILGETGTGKGLVAKALHNEAHRLTDRRGAFVHFNSAAFNAGIIEDALFGHVRGAFSTAHSNQKGLIEAGRNGSVFVDEIGDLDLGLQAKLLDVVENKRVRPLGDTEYRNVDVRFIFATNRKMERLVEEGKFREDLFARINVLPLELPPLRLRKADIPLLVEHFVKIFNEQYYKSLTIDAGATDELFRYDWPRNVRELQSVLFKAAARAGTAANITHFILSDSIPTLPEPPLGHAQHAKGKAIEFDPLTDSWPSIKEKTEEAYFKALAEATQNIEQAMNLSNIGRARLFALFKKHKLQIKAKSSTTDIY